MLLWVNGAVDPVSLLILGTQLEVEPQSEDDNQSSETGTKGAAKSIARTEEQEC